MQVLDVPVQAPPQPIQGCPGSGVAVSVTTVPLAKLVATGFVETVPLPFLLMLILKLVAAPPPPPPPPPVAAEAAKFACTLFSPLILKVHVSCVPAQSPLHR